VGVYVCGFTCVADNWLLILTKNKEEKGLCCMTPTNVVFLSYRIFIGLNLRQLQVEYKPTFLEDVQSFNPKLLIFKNVIHKHIHWT
jgi:hypothetical protein